MQIKKIPSANFESYFLDELIPKMQDRFDDDFYIVLFDNGTFSFGRNCEDCGLTVLDRNSYFIPSFVSDFEARSYFEELTDVSVFYEDELEFCECDNDEDWDWDDDDWDEDDDDILPEDSYDDGEYL